jgi:collectin sub-family protein 10
MRLVTLPDEGARAELSAALAAMYGPVEHWLGLSDREEEGRFVWSDGRSLEETGLAPFAPGEPNDFGSGEDCVHTVREGLWNDLDCGAALPFVCERP